MKPQTEKKCRDYVSVEGDKYLLSPGCEVGFGLPNGSLELPSFSNGKVGVPARPKIRLTRTHASERSPVTVSRDSDTSRGR